MNIEKIELYDKSIIYAFENDYITSKIKSDKDYYESTLLTMFKKYIPKEPVIYDIGANIGNHTVYFSRYTNPKKIYSFEPVKEVYNVLIKNIEVNNIECAQAFNVAIGDKDRNVSMEICNENLGSNKVIDDESGDIKLIVLDNAEIDPPSFIKIDVEGYEFNVLLGLKNTLIKYKPIIWIEIFKENFRDINKFLSELGYEIIERIESNCIYKVPMDESERTKVQEDFKNNIVNYYEDTISVARKKYRESCESANKIKNKLNLANEKYKQATVNYSELQNKTSIKDLEISKSEKLKKMDNERNKANKESESFNEDIDDLIKKNKMNEEIIARLQQEKKDILQYRSNGIELLSNKALTYLEYIEKLTNENEELNKRRDYLVGRTETLYNNNNKLVVELKTFKEKYKALRGSKLGKITVLFWKVKGRWK